MNRYATIHNRPEKPRYNGRRNCGTFVIEVPQFSDLVEFASNAIKDNYYAAAFPLEVGAAFLHPGDQFNKKVGREIAMERLTVLGFNLYSIDIEKKYITLSLTSEDTWTNTLFDVKLRAYYDGMFVRVMQLNSLEKGDTK
jgi:hypothetical protein